MSRTHLPAWIDRLLRPGLALGGLAALYVLTVVGFGASPRTTDVGYAPEQPVPFSHRLHAGELQLDCRYCHDTVERAAHAAVPPTATCMNCHKAIHTDSPLLAPVRESFANDTPLPWARVHDLPDHAYFDHSSHVAAGVGCVSCHGRVDQMDVVRQVEPLSMGWCLDCHREPAAALRPLDRVTDMDWTPADGGTAWQAELARRGTFAASTDCSTCHR